MDGPYVILILKVAVISVTALLIASLIALARNNIRLHGRINVVFATLTLSTVLGLELLVRVVDPEMFTYFSPATRLALRIHLCFSVPSALLIPVLLYSGLRNHRTIHLAVAMLFAVLWIGTFITGVFFLPHEAL